MKLLSDPKVNYKIKKNLKKGYYTYSLNFAHSDISGYNVCPMANRITISENANNKSTCSSVCVGYNGFAQRFPSVMKSRVRKTKMFYEDRGTFLELLESEISKGINKAEKLGFKATFRLNAYSDIRWENYGILDKFKDVTFYDYTKLPNRSIPKNYQLTYSHYGNWNATKQALFESNMNVAMVFDKVPETFKMWKIVKEDIYVINGDETDLRINERDSNGDSCIIGLKFKGSKKELEEGIKDGFVVKA
tara:strand:- start:6606 stop:7349 length:744 start_codon:yes stop_codon:yes gene_type:complete